MFSIIIPTFNNIDYLKLCILSIKKNSKYNHEIIVHINIGNDGTLDFIKNENIKFTFTDYNAGICEGVNIAAKNSTKKYILYSHDDFYFCPDWDLVLEKEIKSLNTELFYLSGTMIQNGQVQLDCGDNLKNFNEQKLLNNYKLIKFYDFQGSTWAPHLIHKNTWNIIGGFSEEYFPGTGSDPDLNKKLWDIGVRIFKGLQHFKVYHFGSIVTRQKEKKYNTVTESGNRGSKIFLLKWGFSIKFFKKHYLKSDTIYNGILDEPNKNIFYFIDLIKCKIYLIYLRIFFKV
tara:strand:+ start:249 stop:1112 length:864 start_codon:yes stop_codon:yes gene_type:complete